MITAGWGGKAANKEKCFGVESRTDQHIFRPLNQRFQSNGPLVIIETLRNRAAGRLRTSEWPKNVAQERECATFFRHSAVVSLPVVLLRKVSTLCIVHAPQLWFSQPGTRNSLVWDFFFSRVLLDTITIVDDNPSVRSSSLQLTASIKERSKVHLLMIVKSWCVPTRIRRQRSWNKSALTCSWFVSSSPWTLVARLRVANWSALRWIRVGKAIKHGLNPLSDLIYNFNEDGHSHNNFMSPLMKTLDGSVETLGFVS